MKRHYGETKAQRQADWLARFSDAVVTIEPRHAGRIDWDTAKHYFFTGHKPQDAANLYVNNRREA
jgi:hypothetical protein